MVNALKQQATGMPAPATPQVTITIGRHYLADTYYTADTDPDPSMARLGEMIAARIRGSSWPAVTPTFDFTEGSEAPSVHCLDPTTRKDDKGIALPALQGTTPGEVERNIMTATLSILASLDWLVGTSGKSS